MTLADIRQSAVEPALHLLPARMNSQQAVVMLLAIQLQEDPQQKRRQWPTGPARGLLQFEQGGGVVGVLRHVASREHAVRVCDLRQVQPVAEQVYAALEHDDVLAMAFGRLLLWTDAYPLPAVGEVEKAFQLYLRTWRPGAYSRGTTAQKASLRKKWGLNYAKAMDAVT